MNNKIQVRARAKINLTLDVLGKRPDGYHEVEMVMQSIELHDVITIEETGRGIEVTTDNPLLAGGESNIAYRAARLLVDTHCSGKGVRIHINKNIPLAAGLAGGSTDAAAVLKGLNLLCNLGLSPEELAVQGALIGSDVPFCVRGGTALARGRGEHLTDLPAAPEMWLVLVKPDLQVSTAEIYQNYDAGRVERRPGTAAMIKALRDTDIRGIAENLGNVLESVTLNRYPVVLEVKRAMEEVGLRRPLMSGSGPTVFGIADDRKEAEMAAGKLRTALPGAFVQVTRTWPAEQQEFGGSG